MMQIPVTIPDSESGDWKITSFEVDKQRAQLFNMQQIFGGLGGRGITEGSYKRLSRGNVLVMSNTPAEIADHIEFLQNAHMFGGHILIHGLGLGVALTALLDPDPSKYVWGRRETKPITKITVIEKSADVIKLVAPYFTDPRVEILHADCFKWKPPKGVKYSVVWHDIWDTICTDNLPEMCKLHRRYGHKTDWQGSWARGICEQERRSEQRGYGWY